MKSQSFGFPAVFQLKYSYTFITLIFRLCSQCGEFTGHGTMGNITVAVLGASGYSSNIAKKGTSTDITLYDLKKGETTVTLIEPTRYPERLAPLFYACALATKALSL